MFDNIIEIYQNLTGRTIPESLVPQYKAWGRRAIIELENKLGWQFDSPETVTVLGCSPSGCDCDIKPEDLRPAPEKKGQYRIFNFDSKQPFVFTDPFTKVHNVYICKVEPEGRLITTNPNEVVILKKVANFSPRYFSGDFGKYLQACKEISVCQNLCDRGCTECTAILVDGDWLTAENIPDELGFLLCDYIDWMSNGGIQNRGITSETVDGHSVSFGSNWREATPYLNSADTTIIQQFAGPYGMASRKLIW